MLARVGRTIQRFSVDPARHVRDHDVDDLAAMMTSYAIMALFPMVLFVVTVALLVLPAQLVRDAAAMTAPLPSYGASASVIIVLLWLWLSNLALLVGAEVSAVIAAMRAQASPAAAALADPSEHDAR